LFANRANIPHLESVTPAAPTLASTMPTHLLLRLALVAALPRAALAEFKVHVVAYDDGPDMDALVDISVHTHGATAGVAGAFLEESSASLAAAPRGGAAMEPPGVGLGAAAGPLAGFGLGTFGGKEPPQDFLPKQAERMMKNKCCNKDGCCGKPADASVEKSAIFGAGLAGAAPSFLDVRSSFLETDSSGRLVQVNKVCCGGTPDGGSAASAGGAGPGGDQFAAASVPAVPCVCTLLADQTAATSSA